MWLPKGTIHALKGHPDAIVFVVIAVIAAGGGAAGGAWFGFALLVIGGGLYHLRRSAAEKSALEAQRLDNEAAFLRVEDLKARHHDLATQEQPLLPLGKKQARRLKGNND